MLTFPGCFVISGSFAMFTLPGCWTSGSFARFSLPGCSASGSFWIWTMSGDAPATPTISGSTTGAWPAISDLPGIDLVGVLLVQLEVRRHGRRNGGVGGTLLRLLEGAGRQHQRQLAQHTLPHRKAGVVVGLLHLGDLPQSGDDLVDGRVALRRGDDLVAEAGRRRDGAGQAVPRVHDGLDLGGGEAEVERCFHVGRLLCGERRRGEQHEGDEPGPRIRIEVLISTLLAA